ncbi:MAG: OsmC family peroxiredoxin [Chloroflexi bacterium]|nr:MAG: OsmC family peroxiredoxin [Chloroflexota bacterium]
MCASDWPCGRPRASPPCSPASTARRSKIGCAPSRCWLQPRVPGSGTMRLGSGDFEGSYSFKSRMEDGPGTNPEELIGNGLSQAGHKPQEIRTLASVHFDKGDKGWGITHIELKTEGNVPGIDEATFQRLADEAKQNCPVSKALAATPITMQATLKSGVTS